MFFLFIIILLISITFHEFAHALVADKLGDPTPRASGRLSFNPLVHIDPIGLLFIVMWGFGWGKPVAYDPFNLADPDKDGAKIAIAGPISSLLLAIAGAILMRVLGHGLLSSVLSYVVMLNVYLAIFNLVPVYPLDGFQTLAGILPAEQREEWLSLRRYGFMILLLLLLPIANGRSPLMLVIEPIVKFILGILLPGGSVL